MVQHREHLYQIHDNNYESSDEESEGNNEDDESEDEYDEEAGEESQEDDEDDEDAESDDDDRDRESEASSDDDSQEPEEQFENEGTTGNVQRLVQRYESSTENPRTIDDETDDTEDGKEVEIHFVPDEDHEDASDSEEEEQTETEGEDEDEDEEEDDEVEDDADDDEEKKLFLDEPQMRDDDEPRDAQREERLRRNILIAAIICCCLVILAVVLGVVLATKEDDGKDAPPPTPKPSSKPTPTPVAVTSSPSAAPSSILDEIFFPVIADTYLRGGDFANTTFGTDDVLQVRTSGNTSDESYILMEFDLSRLPEVNNTFQESQILLQLIHVESLFEDIDSITVIKLPYDTSVDVENTTWSDFTPANGVVGPSFTVGGDTETVLVDITSLIRGDGGVSPLRSGRRLQAATKILLLLESTGGTNLFGEVFRSRESGAETAPLIIHNIITDSPSFTPSVSAKPSFAPSKSTGPTLSSAPTTSRPPSASPSTSGAPSTSVAPTNNTVAPTSINASETFAPTRVGTMSNNNSMPPGSAVPSLAPSRP